MFARTNLPRLLSTSVAFLSSTAAEVHTLYEKKREEILKDLLTKKVNRNGVFVNSDISLKHIDVFGFDYDYTLVKYTGEVHRLIYDHAKSMLVDKFKYPTATRHFQFSPTFAIRGLHLDVKTGFLMKVDADNHIQLGSVYRGHEAVKDEKVIEVYGDTHLPMDLLEADHKGRRMIYFTDLFSIPEMTLYSDMSQFLIDKEIPFDPEYLYSDVRAAVLEIHKSELLHRGIVSDMEKFTKDGTKMLELLQRLKSKGKSLFLITNSPFWFVNIGMQHLTNVPNWVELFDIVVVQARKPKFYFDTYRPFRSLDPKNNTPTWVKVSEFVKNQVYQEGNIVEFVKLTGWNGSRVLYMGDHVYSDLADPTLKHGWKTGAIIPELENEVEKINSDELKHTLSQLLAIESLFTEHQRTDNPDVRRIIEQWKLLRRELRMNIKTMFSPQFGSLFRTEKAPTFFTRRLGQFSHLYTSKIENLLHYPLDYLFYPRRLALPHETPFY